MNNTDNIFLIGPMGAGKSTVGKRLGQLLHREFIDCDVEIERRTGVTIPYIFELEGEAGFRAREKTMLDELSARMGTVLATGGGAVLDGDNRRRLRERGYIVYLHASIDEQLRRTRYDTNRPLLQTANPHARLTALFQRRDPLYREVADLIVNTDGRHARQVAQIVLERLRQLAPLAVLRDGRT